MLTFFYWKEEFKRRILIILNEGNTDNRERRGKMKLFKRKLFSITLSFLLGGTAIVSDYSTMLLAKEPDTGSNEEVILWQESFEENQDDFVNSLVDEQKGSKNVNRIKDEETIEGNVMQLVNGCKLLLENIYN